MALDRIALNKSRNHGGLLSSLGDDSRSLGGLKLRYIFLILSLALLPNCGQKKKEKIIEVPFEIPAKTPPPLPPEDPTFLTFDRFEQEIIDDLQSLPESQRLETTYIWNNRFNEPEDFVAQALTLKLESQGFGDTFQEYVPTIEETREDCSKFVETLQESNWGGTLELLIEATQEKCRSLREVELIGDTFAENEGIEFDKAVSFRLHADQIISEINLMANALRKSEMKAIRDGINFAINSLSVERELVQVTPIGSTGQLYRVDLDSYGITRVKWNAITERLTNAVFSNTIRGQTIRALTQLKTPWVYAGDVFLTAHNSPGLYYYLVEQPGQRSLADFFDGIGLDLQDEFDDLEAVCGGGTESQIALQKNRLICVADADEGSVWTTYDTDSIPNFGDNLNEDPFPEEARSRKIFRHDAQEHLYFGVNGLLYKRLNSAAVQGQGGAAEDIAPADIVLNRQAATKGLSGQIDLVSCSLCHFAGVIPFRDQIGNHIARTPSFSADDKLRGQNIFRAEKMTVQLRKDNNRLRSSLADLGVSQFEQDPLNNAITDPHRLEQSIEQVAATFFLKPDEFTGRLQGSTNASTQLGNLLSGGSVGLDVRNSSFQVVIDDLNLFRDRDQIN